MKPKLRILVVEDSEDDAFLILHHIKKADYDIVYKIVDTAEAMKSALTEKKWDVILSDYQMPNFSGLDALNILNGSGLDLPFIIISGAIGEEVAVEAMKAGAHDYIMKNNLKRLLPAVERELREFKIREERKQYQQNTELLTHALNNASDACFIVKMDDPRFIYVNQMACQSLGYHRDELMQKTLMDIDPDFTLEQMLQRDKALKKEGNIIFESVHKRKDGSVFPVECTISLYVYNNINYIFSMARDITERKRAEAKLYESEEKYRLVFENSPVSIWEEDFSEVKLFFDRLRADGIDDIEPYFKQHPDAIEKCANMAKIVDINQAALILHDTLDKQELLDNLLKTFTPQSLETFEKELICIWNGGTTMVCDAAVKTLKGEERSVSVYFSVCPGYEESLSKIFVSLVDITGRKKTEESNMQLNADLNATLLAIPDMLFEVDRNGVYMNIWVKESSPLWLEKEQLLGRSVFDVLPPYAAKVIKETLEDAQQKGYSFGNIYYLDFPTERKWFELSITKKIEYKKEKEHFIALARDITDRKKAEITLVESEQRYREMFDNSHDSIYLLEVLGDQCFRLLDVNAKYEEEVGIDREKHLGRTIEENTSPEVAAIVNEKYQRCVAKGTVIEETIELNMPQGPCTYNSFLIPIRNGSGKIYRIMGITRDITEEIKSKQALETSQKRLSKAELVASIGHVEYDFEEDVNYWSNGAYEILNVPQGLRRPGKEGYIERIHPDDIERVKAAMEKAAKKPTKFNEVYRVTDFKGNEKVIHGTGSAQFDQNGKPCKFFGIIQDITAMHELNARLRAEEEKFRILAESSPAGIFTSVGEKPVYANKAMLNMIGVNGWADLTNIDLETWIIPEDKIKIARLVEKLDAGEIKDTPYKLTLRKSTENNATLYYDLYVTTFELNREQYIQVMVIDVTDDREKENIQRQLAADSLYINLKNKLTDEIQANLEKIFTANTTYKKEDFRNIYAILKSGSQSDKDWELLKKHFDHLHPEFIAQLKKAAPPLTVNEIKHCACIRMNLDTKEIARFFNVKPSSVQTSRVRLKKKLELPEETDLRDFILGL